MERFDLADYYATYPQARKRGFIKWEPRDATLVVLRQITEVIAEYRAYLPLTLRQVFYRLVGHHGYDKTEKAYKRLGEYLNRARRAQLIPWSAIRDDGEQVQGAGGWDSEDQWYDSVESSAKNFMFDLSQGQERTVIFLVEAAGMLPQIARVARAYGVDARSSGGFNSVTVTHRLASQITRDERPTVVLHVGDFDPSGEAVFDSLAADVIQFARGLGCGTAPEFWRVAVTEDQVTEYNLPSSPAKHTDQRGDWGFGKNEATQAEAFSPDVLAAIVTEACEEFTDMGVLLETQERGRDASDRLVAAIRDLRGAD